jgi:predicted phage-related endonuclease
MITLKFNKHEDKARNEREWLDARMGKVTGTRLKDLVVKRGSGYKVGFYEIIAERIAIPPDGENVMDRGHRLEDEALQQLEKQIGKKVDPSLAMWMREDNQDIAISPDGIIGKDAAAECKCLSSAKHIEAWLKKYYWQKSDLESIPDEYYDQALQYFIVNDNLKTLYFVFYDPRMPKDFFYLTINRPDVQEKVTEYLEFEREKLAEIAKIEQLLTF